MTTIAKSAPAAPAGTSTAHKLKNFGLGGLSGMVATTFVSIFSIKAIIFTYKSLMIL
jgi:hypothetical protein